MNVVVAGGRLYNNYDEFSNIMDKRLAEFQVDVDKEEVMIISALCVGADTMAEIYAKKNGYMYLCMPINWDVYGEEAWKITNSHMSMIGNVLIAFWNNDSQGTQHMIETGDAARMRVIVEHVDYETYQY